MIWIRADANKHIGTGHVMRCLSVAVQLERLGQQVCFLVADEHPVQLLESRGQKYIVLHSDYTRMEEEWEQLKPVLEKRKTGERHIFLLDSYFVTAEYIRKVRSFLPVAYIDDLGQRGLPADLIINYNIYAGKELYGVEETDRDRYLLGLGYAPLREEFRKAKYTVREEAGQVLITTGGSDKYNLAGKILEKILSNPETRGLKICVISGVYNEYYGVLKRMEEKYANVEIRSNVSNMAALMEESDIAVSAGGSTMYELSAVGVPIICFSFVENQEGIVQCFRERELVCYGGNYLRQGDDMPEEVVEKIAMLAQNAELRKQFSAKQRQMVDGLGAERIAEQLVARMAERRKE